jgi:alkylation response protein AidB-like acyl-CoA dehydrogenase
VKKFAANGWLVPSWPKESGGLGESEMFTYLIRNEMAYTGLPIYFAGAHMAGLPILRFGNKENKKFLIPLATGEIEFAIGYTEPGA